jgi:hypothetical protein
MKSGRKSVNRSLVMTALALPLIWPVVGSADDPRTRATDFIGLWEGIDEDDAVLAQLAITCDSDRTCHVLEVEEFFSNCDGPGTVAGVGTLEDGVIDVPEFTLTCPDGTTLTVATILSIDRSNGTLIVDTEGPLPTQILHRLSPRVR